MNVSRYVRLVATRPIDEPVLLRVSEDINFAPCLLARVILKVFFTLSAAPTSIPITMELLYSMSSASLADIVNTHFLQPTLELTKGYSGNGGSKLERKPTDMSSSSNNDKTAGSSCSTNDSKKMPTDSINQRSSNCSAVATSTSSSYAHIRLWKPEIRQCILSPSTWVTDKRLRWEVEQCIRYDDIYSPLMVNVRRLVGLEYEYVLQESIRNLGLQFKDEDDLRTAGYAKTPDVLLDVPIIVEGCLVHWIESKATFADDVSHNAYLPQFWSYQNRYGPGLVIYWFGFVDDLDCERSRGIALHDHFPTQVETLCVPKSLSSTVMSVKCTDASLEVKS